LESQNIQSIQLSTQGLYLVDRSARLRLATARYSRFVRDWAQAPSQPRGFWSFSPLSPRGPLAYWKRVAGCPMNLATPHLSRRGYSEQRKIPWHEASLWVCRAVTLERSPGIDSLCLFFFRYFLRASFSPENLASNFARFTISKPCFPGISWHMCRLLPGARPLSLTFLAGLRLSRLWWAAEAPLFI